MGQGVKNSSRVCQIPPRFLKMGTFSMNTDRKEIIVAAGLIAILSISVLTTYLLWPPIFVEPEPDTFDVLLLNVDQDGNLTHTVNIDTSIESDAVPFWGKTTELTNGGFVIAGFNETYRAYSDPPGRQLLVTRTDEDHNPIWNKTYGRTFLIHSIEETNTGEIAIAHYVEGYDDYAGEGLFQILIIDDEGETVREQSWSFGWLSGFSHCDDGGFILAKEIYNTPDSPYWIARVDTDLSIIWNKTYPNFAPKADIFEDIAGGFTMPLSHMFEGSSGIARLDDQGNEISRVFTNSTREGLYFWVIQCSNGEYLGWDQGYILRFNIEGEILWERYTDYAVHGIHEMSPDRFIAFERAGLLEVDWGQPGVHLECFDASGNTLWSRSVPYYWEFFVPDVIPTSDGGITILGLVDPDQLTSVSDSLSETITPEGAITIVGDANFHDTALLEGWPGDGSPENPYIIDGLDINLGGGEGHGISISHTRVSFIIRN
ncbi:MAG: hypothetical protein ACW99U_01650 [Candidatus Thorarchaeota archaeon]|jgi:hypothetical protein